uniref:ATP synthase F0 subunit 8 n=1 Tax=Cylindrus obtusus TaxID=649475 RepID=I1T1X4_9EUPU|nr:ATP synthase F0 subunit 8 [Cylindrus obtusus]AEK48354.1 ATP synthase F0 subunit 8 [Cylindrus obtusus]
MPQLSPHSLMLIVLVLYVLAGLLTLRGPRSGMLIASSPSKQQAQSRIIFYYL